MTGSARVIRDISPDHPAFAGHFPGQPVLPGASLLAEVLEAAAADPDLAAALGACPLLVSAKFPSAVRPGSSLEIEFRQDTRGVDFDVRCDGATVAKGRFGNRDGP